MERLRDCVRIYGEKMEKKIKKKRKQSDDGRGGEREREWSDVVRWIKSNPTVYDVIRVD